MKLLSRVTLGISGASSCAQFRIQGNSRRQDVRCSANNIARSKAGVKQAFGLAQRNVEVSLPSLGPAIVTPVAAGELVDGWIALNWLIAQEWIVEASGGEKQIEVPLPGYLDTFVSFGYNPHCERSEVVDA